MANEIQRIREATESQLRKVDEVIASNEACAEVLDEISSQLAAGFFAISQGLKNLCSVIDNRFQEVIDILYFQSEMLKEIKEILERPLDTQAKELRKRGEVAYLNNWIDEAEIDLLEAEKKNYQDFIVHHILGNIYFYHKTDYTKALKYYQKSAKYAAPFSKEHVSKVLLCVALVYYKLGQLVDAYNSTKIALELTPDDPHALYHHARYAAKIGNMDEFRNVLRKCVYKEPTYLITADVDDMLFSVKEEVRNLAKELRDEKKGEVSNLIKMIISCKEEAKTIWEHGFEDWDRQLREVNKLDTRNSYLDLLKAKQRAQNAFSEICSWIRKRLESEKVIVEGSFLMAFIWKYYIVSVLTFMIVANFEPLDSIGWFIFFLLIAPITMVLSGICAILDILGIISEFESTIGVVLCLFSGIVLPIPLLMLEVKRENKRLKVIDNTLEKIRKYQETIKNSKT